MIVQQVVRSLPFVKWTPGWSKCYKDTSYTRTKKKVRFKFDYIDVLGYDNLPKVCDFEPFNEASKKLEAELKEALEVHGHKIQLVSVSPINIIVWMADEPIQIIES